jgi:anti-sigma-K factor RskA
MIDCTLFKERVWALALGALGPEERQECEAHLSSVVTHEGCREALARAEATVALLPESLAPVPPGPQVWRAIEAGMESDAQEPVPGWSGRLGWAVAAIAAAALLWVGFKRSELAAELATGRQQIAELQKKADQFDACRRDLALARDRTDKERQVVALLELPATQVVTMAAQSGLPYRARAVVNGAEKKAAVVANELSAQAGKDYELWLIRGNEKIAAGLLHGDAKGNLIALIDPKLMTLGAPDAFAVTVERTGGVPQPEGPIVLLGAMPKS